QDTTPGRTTRGRTPPGRRGVGSGQTARAPCPLAAHPGRERHESASSHYTSRATRSGALAASGGCRTVSEARYLVSPVASTSAAPLIKSGAISSPCLARHGWVLVP